MHNKIKSAFDGIHADDNLKNQTLCFIQSKQSKNHKHNILRPICATFACLALVGFGGYKAYFTPTSVISIDINPSIELDVNRFDRVISVDGYNSDGETFSDSLDIMFKNYNSAIDEILESETVLNCLSNDGSLSIAVLPIDQNQGENILNYVSHCTSQNQNMHCYSLNSDEVADAHSLGLSYGKYKAYLRLQELGIELTPDEVNQMTMREINDLISGAKQNDNTNGNQNANSGQGQNCGQNGNQNSSQNGNQNSNGHHQYGNQNGHHNE